MKEVPYVYLANELKEAISSGQEITGEKQKSQMLERNQSPVALQTLKLLTSFPDFSQFFFLFILLSHILHFNHSLPFLYSCYLSQCPSLPDSMILQLPSEKTRPLRDINQAWHNNLEQDQIETLISRLDEENQQQKKDLKRNRVRDSQLPVLGAPQEHQSILPKLVFRGPSTDLYLCFILPPWWCAYLSR